MNLLFSIDSNENISLLGSTVNKVETNEDNIEELLFNNPDIFGEKLLYIGRQVYTNTGKKLDLLAIDRFRSILVFELKKGTSPRDLIAQVLDYTFYSIGQG